MTQAETAHTERASGADRARDDAARRVLAKVGEASLKGRNRRFFLDALRRNLKAALDGVDARVEDGGSVRRSRCRTRQTAEEVGVAARARLRLRERLDLPGLRARPRGDRRRSRCGVRARAARDVRGAGAPARQVASRSRRRTSSARSAPRSSGSTAAAGRPLASPSLKLRVELDRRHAYVHVHELDGAGGLPVGTSGRAVCLLSGGIDSPVASLLAMKRGLAVDFVHFSGEPYLDPVATAQGAGAGARAERLPGGASRARCGWCRSATSSACCRRSRRRRTGSSSTAGRWRGSAARSRGAARRGGARHRRLARAGLVADASEHDVRRRRLELAGAAPAAHLGQARGDGARPPRSGSWRCRSSPPRTPARCSRRASSARRCRARSCSRRRPSSISRRWPSREPAQARQRRPRASSWTGSSRSRARAERLHRPARRARR